MPKKCQIIFLKNESVSEYNSAKDVKGKKK